MKDIDKVQAYDKLVVQRRKHTARRNAKLALYMKKAQAAKITVTEAEVDAYLKSKK